MPRKSRKDLGSNALANRMLYAPLHRHIFASNVVMVLPDWLALFHLTTRTGCLVSACRFFRSGMQGIELSRTWFCFDCRVCAVASQGLSFENIILALGLWRTYLF